MKKKNIVLIVSLTAIVLLIILSFIILYISTMVEADTYTIDDINNDWITVVPYISPERMKNATGGVLEFYEGMLTTTGSFSADRVLIINSDNRIIDYSELKVGDTIYVINLKPWARPDVGGFIPLENVKFVKVLN